MLSQAKVGTEQIRDYSNTDKFYTLRLFDYGNYVIFYLRYSQRKSDTIESTLVFSVLVRNIPRFVSPRGVPFTKIGDIVSFGF